MERSKKTSRGSPTDSLVVGAVVYALASHWGSIANGPLNPADQFYLGLAQLFGAFCILGGIVGYYRAWLGRKNRGTTEKPSDTYGAAKFATPEECDAAGMLNPHGLYLGRLKRWLLFYGGAAHLLTVAAARQGKGIGLVFPNLCHWSGSVLVTDPKGELAAVTAEHREKFFGHRVFVWNPYGLHGLPQHRFNPLQDVSDWAGDPLRQRAVPDEVKSIVLQLCPEPEDPRNIFFREGTRGLLRFVAMALAVLYPQLCTLPEMWNYIANPARFRRLVAEARRSDALGGLIAALAADIAAQMEDDPEHFADFRAGAMQALDIYQPGSYLADAVSGSDFSLADLKSGKVTGYLVMPQERIATHGAALGLIVNQAIKAVARTPGTGKVLFLLDEFANLGKLAGLAESLTALPGMGVRVWMFAQQFSEVVRVYGRHTAQTILSQSEVKQFFGVNTIETATMLSRALGQKTVKTRNYNLGRFDDDEISESLSETGQPLMRPEDIMQMGKDEQLLFVNGLNPIRATRIPFWCIAPWNRWAKRNPLEPPYPKVRPTVRIKYTKKRSKP